ncbi:aminotransferase class III-fold pyridoxal phosphate-dependent enzyme [Bradyrhizobium sp. CCBAU 45394]|uniref:aminotransferase class III-fold pyridoxal phosphate-dependent enzyme n=1 Tax=Bradyrhizobium sp. CCBAU 45394 TaxID=1325087 RepID=UPI0023036C39|nr:aminotransferase class III-fold pyridoxal phosphate-dependent enzyme [Bradyrhizobium sp. CCBAU 45394]
MASGKPGTVHTGTFRGNNLALISATAAINTYWRSETLSEHVHRVVDCMRCRLEAMASKHGNNFAVRGRGMALGFDCKMPEIASGAVRKAFEKGPLSNDAGPLIKS